MKKIIVLSLFGILALSTTAFEAQATNLTRPAVRQDRKELKDFDKFLRKHRSIEGDLRANPQMINDAQYLSRHKDLESFLRKHPQVTSDLSNDPNYFVDRETRYQVRHH